MQLIEGKNARYCNKCEKLKHFDKFWKDKSKKYGVASNCIKCSKKRKRKYYKENREKILQKRKDNYDYEKTKEKNQKYYEENKDKILKKSREYNKKWYKNNKEKILQKQKEYYEDNKKEINKRRRKIYYDNKERHRKYQRKWERKEYRNNPEFKLKKRLRIRINSAVNNFYKSDTTKNLLGCSVKEFKTHLENEFQDGMTWDNYGDWHIDHIIPCASFDLTDPEQQKKCFHYTNLQPLWAEDNLKKSDKILDNEI